MDEETLVGNELLQKKLLLGGSTLLILAFVPPLPILSFYFKLTIPQIGLLTLFFGFFWIIAAQLIFQKVMPYDRLLLEENELTPSVPEAVTQPLLA